MCFLRIARSPKLLWWVQKLAQRCTHCHWILKLLSSLTSRTCFESHQDQSIHYYYNIKDSKSKLAKLGRSHRMSCHFMYSKEMFFFLQKFVRILKLLHQFMMACTVLPPLKWPFFGWREPWLKVNTRGPPPILFIESGNGKKHDSTTVSAILMCCLRTTPSLKVHSKHPCCK